MGLFVRKDFFHKSLSQLFYGQGLECDMKYHIFHYFRICTPFKKKSSDDFKDFYELKTPEKFLYQSDVIVRSSYEF